jgi:hypothetical protein
LPDRVRFAIFTFKLFWRFLAPKSTAFVRHAAARPKISRRKNLGGHFLASERFCPFIAARMATTHVGNGNPRF